MDHRETANGGAAQPVNKLYHWCLQPIATPRAALKTTGAVLPWLWVGMLLFGVTGFVWGLAFTPPDARQGHLAKIMYLHVPTAWWGLFAYMMLAASSAAFIIWRHPISALLAQAIAPVGTMLTLVCLITGMIWGQPTWGTWWAWDPRLTSMLLLLLLYVGFLLVLHLADDEERGSITASWLAVMGVVNVPIIKYSVVWWNSLHQDASISSIERLKNPAIDNSLLWPLLLCSAAIFCYISVCICLKLEALIYHRQQRRGGT